jgi:trans-aconitate methyltransferase
VSNIDRARAAAAPAAVPEIDTTVPSVARVYDAILGGLDNFAVDRAVAAEVMRAMGDGGNGARFNRAALGRAVRLMAGHSVTQFLDLGSGLPTAQNTHQIAQAVNPASRIVYVDNDPVVLSHARARLRSSAEGTTSCVYADARDTQVIVAGARETLDLAQPVGVIMIDILNFLEDPAAVLARLVAALPAGSYLAVMQPARDERLTVAARRWNQLGATPVFLRDRDQVSRWFTGLELIAPGIVEVHRWRPAPEDPECPNGMPLLGAVARKPGR